MAHTCLLPRYRRLIWNSSAGRATSRLVGFSPKDEKTTIPSDDLLVDLLQQNGEQLYVCIYIYTNACIQTYMHIHFYISLSLSVSFPGCSNQLQCAPDRTQYVQLSAATTEECSVGVLGGPG